MSARIILWEDKYPAEVADYSLEWIDDLEAAESITSTTWTIPAGLTKNSQFLASGDDIARQTVTAVVLAGGVSGAVYDCVCVVTTTGGAVARTLEQIARIRML